MTEDQIERQVERHTDRYDAAFMARQFDQDQYDKLMRDLSRWADEQYRLPPILRYTYHEWLHSRMDEHCA